MNNVQADTSPKHWVAPRGAPVVIFWILLLSLLPLAALFGGTPWLLMAFAIGTAAIVYRRPEEGPSAGMLFLFGAAIVLPYGSRFDFTVQSTEMYYWAAGLFIITAAA